ncbi:MULTISPECIES: hypothetical protein [unclassified Acinetobacter]|uniref:hypothetical protein n=1 Tax=unclassified Acinetobacter TaxID=196816 RepID=UPI0015D25E20|nr:MULTISPECIES: hypothetical protein [unclassified Acinetobacter]
MDESEEIGTPNGAYEKRNLTSYKGNNLPTSKVKVFILNSYFDSLDEHEFTDQEEYKVTEFVVHINQNGFANLPGRNKQSNDPNTNHERYMELAQFAIQYKLHHYHIGVEEYEGQHGDKTSEFVVHYSFDHAENCASIISVSPHYPYFKLPTVDQINSGVSDVFDIEDTPDK